MKNPRPDVLARPNPELRLVLLDRASEVEADKRGALSAVCTAMLCNDFCFRSQLELTKELFPEYAEHLEILEAPNTPQSAELIVSYHPVFSARS